MDKIKKSLGEIYEKLTKNKYQYKNEGIQGLRG